MSRRAVSVLFAGATLTCALALFGASCGENEESCDGATPSVEDGNADRVRPSVDSGRDVDVSDGGLDVDVPLVDTCGDAGVVPGAWVADPRLCLTVFAGSEIVNYPRGIAFAPNADLFVEMVGFIKVLFDANKNGTIEPDEVATFATSSTAGPNHSVVFSPDGAFVYASGESSVVRWPYKNGDHIAATAEEIVVTGMPTNGHRTRTLAFDSQGRLYVDVGSLGDVDIDPALLAVRAQIRRFVLTAALPAGGISYADGEVFVSGLRNEVGLAFDSKGQLWGVENGSDGQYVPFTQNNPAEELNRLEGPGTFYGYPHCWTEFAFDGGLGSGTQWAYLTPSPKTDAWCRDPSNVHRPAAAMQGHWAPLGVVEYTGGSLPWKGDLFITAHGSTSHVPPVGRLLARAHVVGNEIDGVTPVVGHLVDGGLEEGTWDARPVDVRNGPDGALYFSDDYGNRIFRLGYRP